jgi:hypothetical protein
LNPNRNSMYTNCSEPVNEPLWCYIEFVWDRPRHPEENLYSTGAQKCDIINNIIIAQSEAKEIDEVKKNDI